MKKKWRFNPKGKMFVRKPSVLEETKQEAYEEHYGYIKPENEPELVRLLGQLSSKANKDDPNG